MIGLDISNLDLAPLIKKMQIDADIAVRKISFELYTKITRRTPVDTGRARANWNISVGKPDYSTTSSVKVKPPLLNKGEGAIYITNNLPYISALELGHSKQSPPHAMVRRSLAEIRVHYL